MKIWLPVLLGVNLALLWMNASAQDYLQGHVLLDRPPETMAARYFESQQTLNSAYQELFQKLDSLGQRKLDTAQTNWHHYSIAECDFKIDRSAVETLHPMTYNECLIGMNSERTEELRYELQWREMLTVRNQ
jgi:uncharacterized protein YecT (DUF1311 family)